MEQGSVRICVIGTYFGAWPVWSPAFFLSCAKNETIDWLFVTDCEVPAIIYPNIRFVSMTLDQLNALASRKVGMAIEKNAFTQLNLRPAYGVIFDEHLAGYTFWGHCDLDIVWGRIRTFLPDTVLEQYDIISPRKDFLAGHLTLWRNVPEINHLYTAFPTYREIFASIDHHGFDEPIFSTFLKRLNAAGQNRVRVFWSEQMVTHFHGQVTPIGWYWERGKVFDGAYHEYIYMHFQRWNHAAWQAAVSSIDFKVGDEPERFVITAQGIRSHGLDAVAQPSSAGGQAAAVAAPKTNRTSMYVQRLRLSRIMLSVRDNFWAQQLHANAIDVSDIVYDRARRRLLLKPLEIWIGKEQSFLLAGYRNALQLAEDVGARFLVDEDGSLGVEIAQVRMQLATTRDIVTLKQLYVDGIYNFVRTRPAVVWDIGMHAGLAALYFAAIDETVVVGFEPGRRQYDQAMRNVALNPQLSSRIRGFHAGIGDTQFPTIAMYPPQDESPAAANPSQPARQLGPSFIYEEVNIEDAVTVLDDIIAAYPGHEIVTKITMKCPDYHIDGVSEYHLLGRLHATRRLEKIGIVMLEWHKPRPTHAPPPVARQLADYGYKVFPMTPTHLYEGMLYGVRQD